MARSLLHGSALVVDVSTICLQVISCDKCVLNILRSRQVAQPCLHLSSGGVRGAWATLTAGSDGFFSFQATRSCPAMLPPSRRSPPISIHAVTLQEERDSGRALFYDCRDDFQRPRLLLIPSHLALSPVVDIVEPLPGRVMSWPATGHFVIDKKWARKSTGSRDL